MGNALSQYLDENSPLEVNDIIISLNGVVLSEVDGGVPSWVNLFQVSSSNYEHTLLVKRGGAGSPNAGVPISTDTNQPEDHQQSSQLCLGSIEE